MRPTPILMVTFLTFGTAMTLAILNSFCKAGTDFVRYCCNKIVMINGYRLYLTFTLFTNANFTVAVDYISDARRFAARFANQCDAGRADLALLGNNLAGLALLAGFGVTLHQVQSFHNHAA